jgi:fucose permease
MYIPAYCPSLDVKNTIIGLGAFTAPLVATQFSHSRRWSFFYLISLGIATTNVAALTTVFRFKTQDGMIYDIYSINDTTKLIYWTEVYAESGQEAGEVGTARGNKYRQILSLKTVHTLAFFLLVYVGTEVSGQINPVVEDQLDTLPPGYHRRYVLTVQSIRIAIRLNHL